MHRTPITPSALLALLLGAVSLGAPGCVYSEAIRQGDNLLLRERAPFEPTRSELAAPKLLVIAIDGVERELLYELLREGQLPGLARLLGGAGSEQDPFPHAHLDERVLCELPSSTAPSWTSAFTGVLPAVHGLSGNEFFARELEAFVAPVPVTIQSSAPALANWTSGYWSHWISEPTVYERMRAHDPNVEIWVGVHPVYRGADRLLLPDRTVLVSALDSFFVESLAKDWLWEPDAELYREVDAELLDEVLESLEEHGVPDVLTLYLAGPDQVAHVNPEGPTPSRTHYMSELLDPHFVELADALDEVGFLDDAYVVVVSDHGHSQVTREDRLALSTTDGDDPPAVLAAAGYVVRPTEIQLEEPTYYDAVLAYQGAMAYVYLANREAELPSGLRDWSRPPRLREDVLPAAAAFMNSSRSGTPIAGFQGALELALLRDETIAEGPPLRVYVADDELPTVSEWLAEHPQPCYEDFLERLERLARGPQGRRSGDLILLATNASCDDHEDRYYFAGLYQSWHGSPSARDSHVPLIVAHRGRARGDLAAQVDAALAGEPYLTRLTALLLRLRYGE